MPITRRAAAWKAKNLDFFSMEILKRLAAEKDGWKMYAEGPGGKSINSMGGPNGHLDLLEYHGLITLEAKRYAFLPELAGVVRITDSGRAVLAAHVVAESEKFRALVDLFRELPE